MSASPSISKSEPLVVRTLLTALVTGLVHVAVLQGWLTVESVPPEAVAALVDALGVTIAALWSRGAVTPVANPVLQTTITTPLSQVNNQLIVTPAPESVLVVEGDPQLFPISPP